MGRPPHPPSHVLALCGLRPMTLAIHVRRPCLLCMVYLLVSVCPCPLRKRYLPTFLRPHPLLGRSFPCLPTALPFDITQPCMALCCTLPVFVRCMHLCPPTASTHTQDLALCGNACLSPSQLCSNTRRPFLCLICFIFLQLPCRRLLVFALWATYRPITSLRS
jgi:hypothetical protein